MKQVSHSRHCWVTSASLYREDIQSIVDLLRRTCKDVTIESGGFTFESLNELERERGQDLNSLKLSGDAPYISVYFDRRPLEFLGTFLYASDGDASSLATFLQIHELLQKRRRFLSYILHPSLAVVLSVVLLLVLLIVPAELVKTWLPSRLERVLILLPLFGAAVLSFLLRAGVFYRLTLKRAHEHRGFFRRKSDDIFLLVVGAIVGGVITWLLTYLTSLKP